VAGRAGAAGLNAVNSLIDSGASRFFAQSYAEARSKFLAAAEAAGLQVGTHPHPLPGRDGELMAMDVARFGPQDSDRLLIISSACHGVEGYCGSGVQGALLADAGLHAAAGAAGVALLYIHALNPYGFSWLRRTTHENVDLNRNFHDFSQPLPHNAGYAALAEALVPEHWPPTPENESVLAAYAATHGPMALQTATSAGQHEFAQGLFYGGRGPTWSQQTLRQVLQEHATRCARLGWIDLHTGLGPSGHGERIFAGRQDAAAQARAKAWWGQVTSVYDGSSTSAPLTGVMSTAAYEECAQAEFTAIALEYGTLPLPQMIGALRADQWLQNHPAADGETHASIKRQIRDAFYVDTDDWKAQILAQGVEATYEAVSGLCD